MLKNIWNAIKEWFGSEPLRSQFEAIVEEQKKVEAKIEEVVGEVKAEVAEVVVALVEEGFEVCINRLDCIIGTHLFIFKQIMVT